MTAADDMDRAETDRRAIDALAERLDQFESKGHSTVQIAWVRRHFETRSTR